MTYFCNYHCNRNLFPLTHSLYLFPFVFHAFFCFLQGPPCLLDIQKDFPRPNEFQPLYLIPNTNQYWLPNDEGQLEIPRGAEIELQCMKSFANSTEQSKSNGNSNASGNIFKVAKNTRTIRPRCLQDKNFLWHGEKYEFRQFVCMQSARYMVEQLNEKCPDMTDGEASISELYRVGYNVSGGPGGGRFVETMRICHDNTRLRTMYVQHKLLPASVHFQKSVKRLNFSKAGYFKEFNMQHLYSHYNQQQQASVVLQGQHGHLFDNNTLFLARGHLAAKADFIYATQQRATFTFFNVAPQWQAFNGGQWAALEDEVRKFVAKSKLQVDCYTGTWGIMQLPHNSSETQNHEYFLVRDDNNNGLLPVPKLYYRIVVDTQSGRGIALVGVNNPHASLKEIIASYVICQDIREQVGWLRWMRNKNLKKGYLYACQVAEFVKAVGHLPRHLLNVTDILE